jgi:predicted transposase YbfD/YdcC
MNTTPICSQPDDETPSLFECLSIIEDARDLNRRHSLTSILVIAVCCIICGGEGYNDMEEFGEAHEDWFKTFLDLENGIPSHDTFNRVFAALDPAAFRATFLKWTHGLRKTLSGDVIALDGKSLRRAVSGKRMPHMVSAWSVRNGLVLGQTKVSEKSNEITVVPELLNSLNIKGCTVTLDAMGCQKKTVQTIIERKGDYVISLKGNQGDLLDGVKLLLDTMIAENDPQLDWHETIEKGHGRIETRRCWQTESIDGLPGQFAWSGLRSVAAIESIRDVKGVGTTERRYFISSLERDAQTLLNTARSHWAIENSLHWVLDVQFGEDQCRARALNAAENLAVLRHIALNMLKQETTKKRGIKGKQRNAAWNRAYLLKVLGSQVDPS